MLAGEASIHEPVEYRRRQVARIVSWTKNEVWYGSAHMKEAFAEGIDFESEYVKVNKYSNLSSLKFLLYVTTKSPHFDDEAKQKKS